MRTARVAWRRIGDGDGDARKRTASTDRPRCLRAGRPVGDHLAEQIHDGATVDRLDLVVDLECWSIGIEPDDRPVTTSSFAPIAMVRALAR